MMFKKILCIYILFSSSTKLVLSKITLCQRQGQLEDADIQQCSSQTILHDKTDTFFPKHTLEDLEERFESLKKRFDGTYAELRDRVLLLESLVDPADKVDHCSVGMKVDGKVGDNQISASSEFDKNHAAHLARLDNTATDGQQGAWVPDPSRMNRGEWLQVDLLTPTRVTGAVTQGRQSNVSWISQFKIEYGNNESNLTAIQNSEGSDMIFEGNVDENTHVVNFFPSPVTARYFRFVVEAYNKQISLRMDYITC